MGGTPIVSDIIDFFQWVLGIGLHYLQKVPEYLFDFVKFLWQNFKFYDAEQILALSMIFLVGMVSFLALFGVTAAYFAGEGPGAIAVGSGSIARTTGNDSESFGEVFMGEGPAIVNYHAEKFTNVSGTDIFPENNSECEYDYTCLGSSDNCEGYMMDCCPAGSLNEYRCVDSLVSCSIEMDNKTLSELRSLPYNCACTSNLSCVVDEGGDSCCVEGTYHWGFCYGEWQCNITG